MIRWHLKEDGAFKLTLCALPYAIKSSIGRPIRKQRLHVKGKRPSQHAALRRDDAFLVVIDMQERLLPVMADRERVVENALKLVKFARIIGLPILFTEQQNLGETIAELREELKDIEPLIKLEFDCFESSAFTDRLSQLKRTTLIISGIEAHICVTQTALHALAHYKVQVVSDAVSSRSTHNREVALQRMRQAGVIVTSTEMVIYELLGRAGTAEFREALKLVK
jgi:nicotinamidase-related amidase